MKNVLIIHGFTTEYRIPFLKELHSVLQQHNVNLKVVIGQSSKYEKFDTIEACPFFISIRNKYIYFGQKYLLWEPVFKYLPGNDMIIMRQAKKHLINPFVFAYCKWKNIPTGLWGNMKEFTYKKKKPPTLGINNKVDHWFAYNDLTKQLVASTGYPENRITAVQNTIDARREREIYDSLTEEDLLDVQIETGVRKGDIVGLFCSRLYEDKRLPFLLQAVKKVKENIPTFKFIVIGNGPEENIVRAFAQKNADWFSWVGSKYKTEKIKYFKLAHFQLIPGAVGLHIIDSFALSTPIITTQSTTHGVEVSYLKNLENGVMTENNLDAYVKQIMELCKNPNLREKLMAGCHEAGKVYTIENMANLFAQGILATLAIGRE